MSWTFSCVAPEVQKLPISLFKSVVAYLVHVYWLYLIKPMMVGFCWRCHWTVGSSINVLTDLILFPYETAIKYMINSNYLRNSNETTFPCLKKAVNFTSESKKQLWFWSKLRLLPNTDLFISSSKMKAKWYRHKTQ